MPHPYLPIGTLPSSGGRMAHVFVYGTLKTGQPNHRVLLDGAHGRATSGAGPARWSRTRW